MKCDYAEKWLASCSSIVKCGQKKFVSSVLSWKFHRNSFFASESSSMRRFAAWASARHVSRCRWLLLDSPVCCSVRVCAWSFTFVSLNLVELVQLSFRHAIVQFSFHSLLIPTTTTTTATTTITILTHPSLHTSCADSILSVGWRKCYFLQCIDLQINAIYVLSVDGEDGFYRYRQLFNRFAR